MARTPAGGSSGGPTQGDPRLTLLKAAVGDEKHGRDEADRPAARAPRLASEGAFEHSWTAPAGDGLDAFERAVRFAMEEATRVKAAADGPRRRAA